MHDIHVCPGLAGSRTVSESPVWAWGALGAVMVLSSCQRQQIEKLEDRLAVAEANAVNALNSAQDANNRLDERGL